MELMKIKTFLLFFFVTASLVQSKKKKKGVKTLEYSPNKPKLDIEKGIEKVFGKNWKSSDVKSLFDQDQEGEGDYADNNLVESDLFVMIDGSKDIKPMGKIKVK